jgi:regulator of protease activity HflC (stomatin/prohibitin superfamily)
MFQNSYNNIVAFVILVATVAATALVGYLTESRGLASGVLIVGLLTAGSPRLIREWERAVLLRLGKFRRVLEPGIAWVAPGIDTISAMVDMRIRSTPFSAEDALTRDTVPVNVDAVLFWVVTDAKRAILEVEQYLPTINWAAQTTLRDVIGRTELVRMICDREVLDQELQTTIDAKTSEWGITVQSVEIRDVKIPTALEDAMSRKAQADREREARIILAQSEPLVAEQMKLAAKVYAQSDTAMHLRAMNMAYESIKERGALMVIPSGLADSLNTGALGLAAAGFRRDDSTATEADRS